MDTFLVCVPMCLVAAFELIYCIWGRPLLRNIFVSFSTVSINLICYIMAPEQGSFTYEILFILLIEYGKPKI